MVSTITQVNEMVNAGASFSFLSLSPFHFHLHFLHFQRGDYSQCPKDRHKIHIQPHIPWILGDILTIIIRDPQDVLAICETRRGVQGLLGAAGIGKA